MGTLADACSRRRPGTNSILSRVILAWLVAWCAGDAGAQAPAAIGEGLAARALAEGSVRVIVGLDVPFAPEGRLAGAAARAGQRREIAGAQEALARELAATAHRVQRRYRTIPFAALEVGSEGLAALSRSPWITSVREDRLLVPSLDGTVPLVEADQAIARGYDGAGQVVVVMDTGVDAAHQNLTGKLVDEACFSSGPPGQSGDCPNGQETQFGAGAGTYCDYSWDCMHGTHVAGIAAGAGASYPGVAQGAGLISIQVASEIGAPWCDPPCAQIYSSDVIAALEYVYDTLRLSYPIAAVNMSFAGTAYTTQASCDVANPDVLAAIDNLRSVEIAPVAASGNGSQVDAIGQPACLSSAVSVAATRDDDSVWSNSNAADFLSLWAPGAAVMAPRYKTQTYISVSGTSMAAPHVAGAWALLRHALPGASVDAILTSLQDTGVPITWATTNTTRIRIAAALDTLLPDCGDGLDNDGDGLVDFPADPGCWDAAWPLENPACNDGLDNDGDGGIDADGTPPDPECAGQPWRNRELPGTGQCGLLGIEVLGVFVLARLTASRRRRRQPAGPRAR